MPAWLVKSEPSEYSYADLERDGTAEWDGVKNNTAQDLLQHISLEWNWNYFIEEGVPWGSYAAAGFPSMMHQIDYTRTATNNRCFTVGPCSRVRSAHAVVGVARAEHAALLDQRLLPLLARQARATGEDRPRPFDRRLKGQPAREVDARMRRRHRRLPFGLTGVGGPGHEVVEIAPTALMRAVPVRHDRPCRRGSRPPACR